MESVANVVVMHHIFKGTGSECISAAVLESTFLTASGKAMCGGQGQGCISTTFPSHGVQYSRVCGRITGYRYYSTNAFLYYINNRASIDGNFVDGIVLTHGLP